MGIWEFLTKNIETERISHWLLISISGTDHVNNQRFNGDMLKEKLLTDAKYIYCRYHFCKIICEKPPGRSLYSLKGIGWGTISYKANKSITIQKKGE